MADVIKLIIAEHSRIKSDLYTWIEPDDKGFKIRPNFKNQLDCNKTEDIISFNKFIKDLKMMSKEMLKYKDSLNIELGDLNFLNDVASNKYHVEYNLEGIEWICEVIDITLNILFKYTQLKK